jgi:hypothetical protein
MIVKIFKKILGRPGAKEAKESKISVNLHEKASKVQKFLEDRFEFANEEFYVIKKKLEDDVLLHYLTFPGSQGSPFKNQQEDDMAKPVTTKKEVKAVAVEVEV